MMFRRADNPKKRLACFENVSSAPLGFPAKCLIKARKLKTAGFIRQKVQLDVGDMRNIVDRSGNLYAEKFEYL